MQVSREARPARMLGRERVALALLGIGTIAFLPGALNRFVFAKLVVLAVGVLLAASVPARGRLQRIAIAMLTVTGPVWWPDCSFARKQKRGPAAPWLLDRTTSGRNH
jgi:hypothetical protein